MQLCSSKVSRDAVQSIILLRTPTAHPLRVRQLQRLNAGHRRRDYHHGASVKAATRVLHAPIRPSSSSIAQTESFARTQVRYLRRESGIASDGVPAFAFAFEYGLIHHLSITNTN